jgi:N6-L-threonylcarbamoyladenine synthase
MLLPLNGRFPQMSHIFAIRLSRIFLTLKIHKILLVRNPFLENHSSVVYHGTMRILGIETSCDETSAAVVDEGIVRSNVVSSQLIHARYGGVVPELASRAHQRLIIDIVDEALRTAGTERQDVAGVAATYGPGLAGALLVGLSFGKALAYGLRVPFVGVNHMEGHLYSNLFAESPHGFPFLSLIVSGGHTMLVRVDGPFLHTVLGQTRDDAAGEAFDKVAKMLRLGYPGGPVIDRLSRDGDRHAIEFPRAYLGTSPFDFSFSGVKTAVLYHLRRIGYLGDVAGTRTLDAKSLADICACFQEAVVDVLVRKTLAAAESSGIRDITMAGGVSANSRLRERMGEEATRRGYRLFYPPLEYCMDNGAMIAYVGWMRLRAGVTSALSLSAAPNLELQ